MIVVDILKYIFIMPLELVFVTKNIPKTGDTADLALWGGLVLLGIAGLVFVMKQYHSEKRKKK